MAENEPTPAEEPETPPADPQPADPAAELEQLRADLTAAKQAAESAAAAHAAELEQLRADLTAAQKSAEERQTLLTDRETQLANLRTESAALSEKMTAAESAHAAALAEKDKQIKELEDYKKAEPKRMAEKLRELGIPSINLEKTPPAGKMTMEQLDELSDDARRKWKKENPAAWQQLLRAAH